MFSVFVFVLLAVGIAGCSSAGKPQCSAANWEQLGRKDGEVGRPPNWIEKHQKKCAGEGVLADVDLYRRGREQGLRAYCTPTSGYRVGSFGRTYENVCPTELEPAFLGGVAIGQKVQEIRLRQEEIANRKDEIDAALGATRIDNRAQLALLREKDQLQQELRRLEAELGRIRQEAKTYIDSQS